MVRYPSGQSSFEDIRNTNCLYVDKTAYIKRLIDTGKYFFLGRPRRFGKSLFISTLEAFFLGKKQLFDGLDIASYDWTWVAYPVIHLDFAPASYRENWELEQRINNILEEYERVYNLSSVNPRDIAGRLNKVISRAYEQTGRQVVVLVDEYEKPVIDNLDNEEVRERNRAKLSGFYGVLKSLDAKLKMVFLTGVTKFGQMSVFSGMNHISDISLLDEYGEICGITEDELLDTFSEGIEELARVKETNIHDVVALLKEYYDGYHFSARCRDLYNPYSIIQALSTKKIEAYWASTGTPSFLVATLMNEDFNLEDLEGFKADYDQLTGVDNQVGDPIALFYQTGYLTIKGYNIEEELYTLGYPNREVEKAFFKYLLPKYAGQGTVKTDTLLTGMRRAIISGLAEKMLSLLKSYMADISYDLIPRPEVERHFQTIMTLIFKAVLPPKFEVKVENKTSDGRSDIEIKTDRFIYIIEIKIDSTARKALEQIKMKDYALRYRHDGRHIFLIGVNFSKETRRIEDWMIEEL